MEGNRYMAHQIEFEKEHEREKRQYPCKHCGEPSSQIEMVKYNGCCEDCYENSKD